MVISTCTSLKFALVALLMIIPEMRYKIALCISECFLVHVHGGILSKQSHRFCMCEQFALQAFLHIFHQCLS